jgi:hypothetical protein
MSSVSGIIVKPCGDAGCKGAMLLHRVELVPSFLHHFPECALASALLHSQTQHNVAQRTTAPMSQALTITVAAAAAAAASAPAPAAGSSACSAIIPFQSLTMKLTNTTCSSSSSLTSQLASGPRLAGQVALNAYDAALHGIICTQCLQYEGLLPVEALEAGLAR